ncbi:MAG: alginate export family protein [Sphingobium sp.]|nr:alginate export family protein [Hyphomonadaceae bacterium]MCI1272763.1 alginate export family protein [Sphingobium sp.]
MKRISLSILLLVPTPAFAEDGLSLGGSTRLRYEVIDGQPRAGFNESDDLVSIRTIVTGEYRTGRLRLGAELYDSRVYGGDAGTPITTGEVNTLELVQAYIGYEAPGVFGPDTKLGLQAGRFTLNLGSRRLVAADDYRNTTNGYTGVRADIALPDNFSTTAIYTLPQMRLPDARADLVDNRVRFDRESFDLILWGGLFAKKLADKRSAVELSFYHLGERDSPRLATRDRSLDTASLRLVRDPAPGSFDFESETIYQWGSISASVAATAPTLDVSAWFAHLEAGYTFRHPWSPHLSIEFDYASGDGRGAKFTRFDTLFGMRRADLAPAGIYNAVGRANLIAPGLRIEVAPAKRVDAFAAYRPLWLASRYDSFSTTGVRDPSGSAGRFAGHQVEARVRYWLIPKRLRMEWNGVLLAKGRFLRDAPNAPTGGDTIYNSFNATISF